MFQFTYFFIYIFIYWLNLLFFLSFNFFILIKKPSLEDIIIDLLYKAFILCTYFQLFTYIFLLLLSFLISIYYLLLNFNLTLSLFINHILLILYISHTFSWGFQLTESYSLKLNFIYSVLSYWHFILFELMIRITNYDPVIYNLYKA